MKSKCIIFPVIYRLSSRKKELHYCPTLISVGDFIMNESIDKLSKLGFSKETGQRFVHRVWKVNLETPGIMSP